MFVFCLLVTILVWLSFWLPTAQATERNDQLLALLLARTCVAEIGFKGEIAECNLMWTINRRNALVRNRSLRKQTLLFNAYWQSPKRQKKYPWIKHLAGTERPRGWSKKLKWAVHRNKWLELRRAALAFVKQPQAFELLCVEAVDYGSATDVPDSPNFELVKCLDGNTRQRYWRLKPWKVNYKNK
jgi:hypothetical protein